MFIIYIFPFLFKTTNYKLRYLVLRDSNETGIRLAMIPSDPVDSILLNTYYDLT